MFALSKYKIKVTKVCLPLIQSSHLMPEVRFPHLKHLALIFGPSFKVLFKNSKSM